MHRILCVWLPYWATTRLKHARGRAGSPPDEALVTVRLAHGVRRLVSVSPRAEQAGLVPGQTMAQARALCTTVQAADEQPDEDATALASLAQWCTRYTPLVAYAAPDTLWLDIAGCNALWPSEAALAEDLATRFARWDLMAGWAIAPTAGAAWALARYAPRQVVGTHQQKLSLASLPVEALRLPDATAAGLRRLGLRTISSLARLPRPELAERFGAALLLRLDQAYGTVAESLGWQLPSTDWQETERFAEPILSTEACTEVLRLLAYRLCTRLANDHQGGRHFTAACHRVDGAIHPIAIATTLPVHDPAWVHRLLTEKLNGLDPGFGIEQVTLAAYALEPLVPRQKDFTASAMDAPRRLAELLDTLATRLRPGRLWRYEPRESHIPEHATAKALPLAAPKARFTPDAPRPLRLLQPPEPIAVTAPLPDDPPVQFRWRGALHRVRAATGPERIAPEWWKSAEPTRDYYRVEDAAGTRYWMFRAGRDWFLHGLFG